MKIIMNLLSLIIAVVLGLLLVLLIVLLILSPGKPEQFLDSHGKSLANSISEKLFLDIGGVRQGMFIRTQNINHPVLLYVHGGPAFPNYFLIEKYQPGLEEQFTVCYWEQRGGGLSFSPEVPLETMTFEQLTLDAIEVTEYLRKRFNQQKIYLMAHSGGTPIAIQAAARAPQLFHAYIGMAQVTNQGESERLAYQYMFDRYTVLGNTKALTELRKFPVLQTDTSFVPFFKSLTRDKSMHDLGIGTMRSMHSVISGVFIPVWTCRAYTLKEKIHIWESKFKFVRKAGFVEELFRMDIPAMIPGLDIPVYFLSGKYDLTVNYDLSKAYLHKLQAPVKGFYTFGNSAHSPLFEEPERVIEILKTDVLGGKADLADPMK